MDCKTAQSVWNHPEGLVAGIRQHLPGVMEMIEANVQAYVTGAIDAFDQRVKSLVETQTRFFVTHADTEADEVAIGVHGVVGDAAANYVLSRHFSELHGRTIALGNICCGGHITHDGSLTPRHLIEIQVKAVNIDPASL